MRLGRKGFTLIELVIVIVIIGILAAVAVPKFADIQKKAQLSNIKGTVTSTRSALNIRRGDNMLTLHNQTTCDYWPTLTELQYAQSAATLNKADCPLQSVLPGNPFRKNSNTVDEAADGPSAEQRKLAAATAGWVYWATSGIFYCNTSEADAAGNAANTF